MNWKWLSFTALAGLVACIVGLYHIHAIFGAGPITITIQVIAALLMVWARLMFGIRSFHGTANSTAGGLVTTGPYRYIRHPIYAAILYFVWADRGPLVPGHRSGRPSCDGAYGSADRSGREAAGYDVPGVPSICAGDQAGGSVCPIASRAGAPHIRDFRMCGRLMVCLTQPPTQILQLPSGGYSSKPVLLGRGFSGELGAPGTRLESCSRLSTGTAHWGMVIPCFLGRRSEVPKIVFHLCISPLA